MGIFYFFRKNKTKKTESETIFNKTNNAEDFHNTTKDEIQVNECNIKIVVAKEVLSEDEDKRDAIHEELKDYDPTKDLSSYCLPTVDLLNEYDPINISEEEIEDIKSKITSVFQLHNIEIISINANIGYINTLYEIVPKAGFRISIINI